MHSVHVSSTKDRDLPPPELGPGLDWDGLTEVLLREVSADAAALLAEPVHDAARGQTNWHITAREDPKPISALSDVERDKLLSRLNDRRREIERFAASVEAENGDANLRLAAALRAVLNVPDERQHIWSADGKPVLTAWGRKPGGRQPPAQKPFRRQAGPPPQSPPATAAIRGTGHFDAPAAGAGTPPPIAARPKLWPAALLWVIFMLLVGAGYYALLPACGLQLGWLGIRADRCDFDRSSELAALEMRNTALREAIAEAELRVAQNHGACLAPPQRSGLLDRASGDRTAAAHLGKL